MRISKSLEGRRIERALGKNAGISLRGFKRHLAGRVKLLFCTISAQSSVKAWPAHPTTYNTRSCCTTCKSKTRDRYATTLKLCLPAFLTHFILITFTTDNNNNWWRVSFTGASRYIIILHPETQFKRDTKIKPPYIKSCTMKTNKKRNKTDIFPKQIIL